MCVNGYAITNDFVDEFGRISYWVAHENAQLIEAAGYQVVYLPPYSPDFNLIEKCWVWLKSCIRKQLRNSDNLPNKGDYSYTINDFNTGSC